MKTDTHDFAYSEKGKRKISSFMSHLLLFDLVTDHLDTERKQGVSNYLKYSLNMQNDANQIKNALEFLSHCSEIKIQQNIIKEVQKNAAPDTIFRLKKIPSHFRQGFEPIFITFIVVSVFLILPWKKALDISFFTENKEIILAEAFRIKPVKDVYEKAEFSDEEVKKNEGAPDKTTPVVAPTTNSTTTSATTTASPSASVQPPVATDLKKPEVIGFLFRGTLPVKGLDTINTKIQEKIIELGGRKAGSVDLGWKKNPQTAYFHFTIPEAKSEELKIFLKLYGKLVINKEKHSRVMADGISRYIITLEEIP